jgi:LysM repeat protein
MNFKRLFFYLLLNVIVSATTILIVLNIWDRTNRAETTTPEQVSLLPTVIASAIPPTNTPIPEPTMALRPYQVEEGETLGEIALQFGTSVDQLLEINSLSDPDALVVGMVLLVPASYGAETVSQDEAHLDEVQQSETTQAEINSGAALEEELTPTQTSPPTPEDAKIRIISIVGANDLATEHIEIRSVSSEALPLEGWQLKTNDGLVYTFPNITLFEYGAVDLYSRAGINSVVALYWGRSTPVFQSGDRAVIYDAEGNTQAVYNIP